MIRSRTTEDAVSAATLLLANRKVGGGGGGGGGLRPGARGAAGVSGGPPAGPGPGPGPEGALAAVWRRHLQVAVQQGVAAEEYARFLDTALPMVLNAFVTGVSKFKYE